MDFCVWLALTIIPEDSYLISHTQKFKPVSPDSASKFFGLFRRYSTELCKITWVMYQSRSEYPLREERIWGIWRRNYWHVTPGIVNFNVGLNVCWRLNVTTATTRLRRVSINDNTWILDHQIVPWGMSYERHGRGGYRKRYNRDRGEKWILALNHCIIYNFLVLQTTMMSVVSKKHLTKFSKMLF